MLAWIHIRRSRHLGDPDDPQLLVTHHAILTRLAQADGTTIPPSHVIGEVESGEFLSHRPAFLAFLEQVERLPANTGGVLYCLAFDRLSRGDPLERARVRVALRRAGILVRTPAGWLDLNDPDQSLLAGVRSELAEHELARFKQRVALTRAEKLRRGQIVNGAVPFGYTWDKNRRLPVPHPDRFPILCACCREILTTSLAKLAARYAIPPSVLRRALHCPTIAGWAARHYDGSDRIRPRQEWVWAEEPGGWPAACSRAEWETIQQALGGRQRRPLGTAADGWCREVVRFVDAAPAHWVRLQTGGRLPSYCAIDPVTKERGPFVARRIVNAAVTAALLPLLADAELLAFSLEGRRLALRQQAAAGPAREAVVAELAERRQQMERAVRLAVTSPEVGRAQASVIAALDTEIRGLVQQLQVAPAPPADLGPLIARLAGTAGFMADDWQAAPGSLKRQLVNALIAAVPIALDPPSGKRQPKRVVLPVVWHPEVRPCSR